jgi:serine/threonine protein kinase/tetratricopeptide (TPR) repeat protein
VALCYSGAGERDGEADQSVTTFGRYRLLERLGQGGMAEVFKAKSFGVEGFEKVLVIKRILPELAQSKEFVDLFIHEAKLAVRLSHANIVQVFDLGIAPSTPGPSVSVVHPTGKAMVELSGSYFMAMEFVHGFDLATLLSRCRRQQTMLPIELCVYIAAEVAKGLDHAHRRRDEQLRPLGIVHRDVSPQNVLLSLEGEVKVTDFGIAKARGAFEAATLEDTKTRRLHGKYGYMSPEQAHGEAVDARSDLFSLGVVLYECVAGVNPFSAPTVFETLRRVQACEYPPIELLRPDAPPELVTILKTAMAKSADDRYADAGRMYEAMLAFLYAQGSRAGAHDLAEFMIRFRESESAAVLQGTMLEAGDAVHAITADRTPVEVPQRASTTHPPLETGVRIATGDVGERREVTALVIEFPQRDSQALAERAIAIVKRYGGRVLRHEPEHLAVLFGLDEPDGRDTEVATRCALVTLRALDALPGDPTAASAGLHSARILVKASEDESAARGGGSEGGAKAEPKEDERLAALLSTSREFARARAGRCAISAAAMRQVRGLFDLEPLTDGGDQPRTGLSGSIVRDVRSVTETFGRFVGRKDELRVLGEALASATKRRARIATIRGDHGVGKTRFLYEVERRLQKGGYNVAFYMATCPPRGRELPLSGIVSMLQVLCGLSETDSPERVLAVQPRLRALGLNDQEVATILNTLGVASKQASGAANAKNALKQALWRMLSRLCEDKPYALAWDAAHAMDEDSFDVLDAAFERLTQSRIVLILVTRAGFSHPLEKHSDHVGLDLGDLPADDAERLVSARLGVESTPDELLRFVRDRAGGHPLFIEEVLKGLLDAQAVTVADRKVVSMRMVGQDLALPKTLRGLVASRVARLSPADKTTLQAAAVLGEPVESEVLAEMLDQPMSALEGSLAHLGQRELLVHTGPSELRFMSPILREVVVDALPPEAARQMHGVAAHALERVLGDKAREQSARIASHYYESGRSDQAATYFARSGERRREAHQLEAATRDYGHAIALADVSAREPSELEQWLSGLTQTVRIVRACPQAEELCARVLERVDAAGGVAIRVQARVDAGVMLSALHNFELARSYFAEAEQLADGHEASAKAVLLAYADLATRQGDFNRAVAMLERLQLIVTEEGDKAEAHKILLYRSQAHAGLGDKQAALAALGRAEQLLPQDNTAMCMRQKLRSLAEYFSRDFQEAVASAEIAVDMARALGVPYEVAINLHNLGDFLLRLDDFPRSYGAIRQSLELCEEGGFSRLASQNRMFLAFLDGINGDLDAEDQLRQGIEYAERNDYTWDAVNGRTLLGQLLRRRGRTPDARRELEKAHARARDAGNRLLTDDCEAALRSLDVA